MNYSLLAFAGLGVLLLAVLAWLSFSRLRNKPEAILSSRAERECRHISYLPHIKQALSDSDIDFLKTRGSPSLLKRIRKDRRRIAITYLEALRSDFEKLLHFARVVAVMSPEVEVVQELQSARLHLEFSYRYYLIYLRLVFGVAPSQALGNLSDIISALTVRMETAITELGERAALGAEFSPFNGGGMDAS